MNMKRSILILLNLFSFPALFAINDSLFPLNEFSVSFNQTILKDNNTENGQGFGLGAYRSCLKKKHFDIICGLEFNRTTQLKKFMYDGHFSHYSNTKYHINSISIPIAGRLII